jgi:hypothetical protein
MNHSILTFPQAAQRQTLDAGCSKLEALVHLSCWNFSNFWTVEALAPSQPNSLFRCLLPRICIAFHTRSVSTLQLVIWAVCFGLHHTANTVYSFFPLEQSLRYRLSLIAFLNNTPDIIITQCFRWGTCGEKLRSAY